MFQVELREFGKPQKFIVTLKAVNAENLSTLMKALKAGNERVIPQTIIQVCVLSQNKRSKSAEIDIQEFMLIKNLFPKALGNEINKRVQLFLKKKKNFQIFHVKYSLH